MIHPGRVFVQRMYNKFASLQTMTKGKVLKQHHHVKIDDEFRFDCEVWRLFLNNYQDLSVCRTMLDLQVSIQMKDIGFYSDVSTSPVLGFGAVFQHRWIFAQWEPGYIKKFKPSIEYLELYALTAALLTWGGYIKNSRFTLHCDNLGVVSMVNNLFSSCKNCMYLLRLIAFNNLVNNRRLQARHLRSEENF